MQSRYATVVIEQLDKAGEPFRTFRLHPERRELDATLHRVTYAYHLPATRVTVDGRVVTLSR